MRPTAAAAHPSRLAYPVSLSPAHPWGEGVLCVQHNNGGGDDT